MGIRPTLTDEQAKIITSMLRYQKQRFTDLLNSKPHALGDTDLDGPINHVVSIIDGALYRLSSAEPFPEPKEDGK